jgi:murein DD-endopeptidase MepM/ murein hydrolase activator NlpD
MPEPARPRHLGRSRKWLTAAAIGVITPIVALSSTGHPAFATTDEQKLSQLQHDASTAASDIGVRDAAAQNAAIALTKIRSRVSAAERTLASANQQLRAAQSTLTKKRDALASAQTQERRAEAALQVATAKYNKARDELRLMLRTAFEEGVGGDLDAIMQGGTPDELANRVGLLDRLSATRQERLAELGKSRNELTKKQRAVSAARGKAQAAVVSADSQVRTVAALQTSAQTAASRLTSLQRQQESAVKTAKASAAQARVKYNQLQAASARLQQILAARASSASAVTAVPLSTGHLGPESAGGLVMPTTGTFSSGFGYRVDPFGLGTTFHAGQDIAAPTGTPIIAATAGTVAIVETPDQSGGYGNYTCIDRGAGFATCYAHQSVVFVHVGQVVAQGQTIGLVGSTGASTGPHLHFEVRLNGVPVDPVPYLP